MQCHMHLLHARTFPGPLGSDLFPLAFLKQSLAAVGKNLPSLSPFSVVKNPGMELRNHFGCPMKGDWA